MKNKTNRHTFSIQLTSSFFANGVSLGLLFLIHIVLARYMNSENYGEFIFLFSIISILVLLSKFGLDSTLQRYVPAYIDSKEWAYCKGLMLRSYQVSTVMSLTVAGIFVAVVFVLLDDASTIHFKTLLTASLLIPVVTLLKVNYGIFLSYKRPGYAVLFDGIFLPGALLIVIAGYGYFFDYEFTPAVVFVVYAVIAMVSVLAGLYYLYKISPVDIFSLRPAFDSEKWIKTAVVLLMMSGMQLIMSNTDTIMIGLIIDTKNSGFYNAASRIATLVSLPLIFFNMVLAPNSSELFSGKKLEKLQVLVSKTVLLATVAGIPVLIALIVFGEFFLSLFGDEFIVGNSFMMILMFAQLINVLFGSVGVLMAMTGQHKEAARVLLFATVVNVVLNIILIPEFGMLGAALATSISIILWNVILARRLKILTNINATIFSLWQLKSR